MKQIKIILWLIILGLMGLVVYQNQDLFLDKQRFGLNLYVIDAYTAPDLPNAIFLLACFLGGLLFAYFFGLAERFKSRKTIKMLNAMVDAQVQEISALKNEMASLNKASGNAQGTYGDAHNEKEAQGGVSL